MGKIFGLWHGGASYSRSTMADLESFDSVADAESALESRYSGGQQTFRYVGRNVDHSATPAVDETSHIELYAYGNAAPDRVVCLDMRGYAITVTAEEYSGHIVNCDHDRDVCEACMRTCRVCKETKDSQDELRAHVATEHAPQADHGCPHCGRVNGH
jgi:hypothetical protein